MSIIVFEGVEYAYDQEKTALSNLDLRIEKGEFVAVIGHNGSGKSTLAKHINALFLPTAGEVRVLDMDTRDEDLTLKIRSHAGMVFQNPDNQMVTTIVEDDIAFGPENLGVAPDEIRRRVDAAIAAVGIEGYVQAAPQNLSGGQKQRIAIASVLAMQPDIMVLDEPTAMLDPAGRKEVLDTVLRLNREQGMTVVFITHFMEEAALADRIVVVSQGEIALEGSPLEVFVQQETLDRLGLDVPFSVRLAHRLRALGMDVPITLEEEELVGSICHCLLKT